MPRILLAAPAALLALTALSACGTRTSLAEAAGGDGGSGGEGGGRGGDGGFATSSSLVGQSAMSSADASSAAIGSSGSGSSGSGSSGSGSSGSGSSGASVASASSGVPDDAGCSDGTREAFTDRTTYPDIAACDGGFRRRGLDCFEPPSCDRLAGNDGAIPQGQGCHAEDLCQVGFHVCTSAVEVAARSPNGCDGASDAPPESFYATRQGGPGNHVCATCGGNECLEGCQGVNEITTNDLFGCGNTGVAADAGTCGVLDRTSDELCGALPMPWRCGDDGFAELSNVRKRQPWGGGVLCCRDL